MGRGNKPHCYDRTHLGAQVNCMSLIIVRDDFGKSIFGLFLVIHFLSLFFSLSFCLFLTFAYIFCRFPIGSRIADKEIAPPSTKSKFFLTGYKTEQIIAVYI